MLHFLTRLKAIFAKPSNRFPQTGPLNGILKRCVTNGDAILTLQNLLDAHCIPSAALKQVSQDRQDFGPPVLPLNDGNRDAILKDFLYRFPGYIKQPANFMVALPAFVEAMDRLAQIWG